MECIEFLPSNFGNTVTETVNDLKASNSGICRTSHISHMYTHPKSIKLTVMKPSQRASMHSARYHPPLQRITQFSPILYTNCKTKYNLIVFLDKN